MDLPEDLLLKEQNHNILQVQEFDVLKTFYEYENGNFDINVQGRLKKSFNFWNR